MRAQAEIMREAGYITAAEAKEAIGVENIGTIHRQVKTGKLVGTRAGKHWYVSVKSLLEAHADVPPLVERILALGVAPKETPAPTGRVRIKKGGTSGRRRAST